MFLYQLESLLGWVTVFGSNSGITAVKLGDKKKDIINQEYPGWFLEASDVITDYFHSKGKGLEQLPIDWPSLGGTAFQQRVWRRCRDIGYGETVTYGWLAGEIGCGQGAQAVGQALGKNPVPLLIPCHRVVSKQGLGGFTGGTDKKVALLTVEGVMGFKL